MMTFPQPSPPSIICLVLRSLHRHTIEHERNVNDRASASWTPHTTAEASSSRPMPSSSNRPNEASPLRTLHGPALSPRTFQCYYPPSLQTYKPATFITLLFSSDSNIPYAATQHAAQRTTQEQTSAAPSSLNNELLQTLCSCDDACL